MRAIILAAGQGSRLKPYTNHLPKSLLPIGNTTLIHRNVKLLKEVGISEIALVVGYLKEKFFSAFPSGVKFYVNENYRETDQAGSLLKACQELCDDVLILTADLCCSQRVVRDISQSEMSICVAIEKRKELFDDMMEKIFIRDNKIVLIGKINVSNEVANGEFLGITKLKKEMCHLFVEKLEKSLQQYQKTQIVQILQQFLDEEKGIGYVACCEPWCEVDDLKGLEKAKEIIRGI